MGARISLVDGITGVRNIPYHASILHKSPKACFKKCNGNGIWQYGREKSRSLSSSGAVRAMIAARPHAGRCSISVRFGTGFNDYKAQDED